MTNPAGHPMDAVAVLMKERQRLEEWIAQLESRRSITPPHVFERVRGDYDARLKDVMRQLSGRTSEVQGTVTALTERLARLQIEETAIRDERYEAELRSHVGEITAQEWVTIERRSDDRIAKIASERTTIASEIGRLQQLLSMSGTPGSSGGNQAIDNPPRGADRQPDVPRSGSFDELEFLKSVTAGARSGAVPALQVPPEPPARAAVPADATAVRTSRPVPRAATPVGLPAASDVGVPTAPAPSLGGSAPAPNAAEVPAQIGGGGDGNSITAPERDTPAERPPEPVPSFLRDVPQEAAKTLRCHDCGTMNLPTEWYCERCGGELAAM